MALEWRGIDRIFTSWRDLVSKVFSPDMACSRLVVDSDTSTAPSSRFAKGSSDGRSVKEIYFFESACHNGRRQHPSGRKHPPRAGFKSASAFQNGDVQPDRFVQGPLRG